MFPMVRNRFAMSVGNAGIGSGGVLARDQLPDKTMTVLHMSIGGGLCFGPPATQLSSVGSDCLADGLAILCFAISCPFVNAATVRTSTGAAC